MKKIWKRWDRSKDFDVPRVIVLPSVKCIKCLGIYYSDIAQEDDRVKFTHMDKPCEDRGKIFEVSIANFYQDIG